MPNVLDTHAWVWWVTNDRRLSSRARTTIERSAKRGELYLSIFSVWEMAKKVEKGQLSLDRPLDEWLDAATVMEGLQLTELTRPVLVDSCRLPQPFHGDPADQIIVATTRSLSATLVTKDSRLQDYTHVRTTW
jgi:PIN domain nuclease of toxin-antitoxin system